MALPGWNAPRIVAHRGGGALAPENTLGGMRLAASLGFRGVEFDVMLAGDGTPVVFHDETLERTTNGRGQVAGTSYEQLVRLDAGGGERIPRFAEAAGLCIALGLWANVEIKPARGHERATGRAVAALAREHWREAQCPPVLSSFSLEALEAAREADPDAALGLLVERVPADWRATLERLRGRALHCHHEALSRRDVDAVREAGHAVVAWTVNEPAAARRLLDWGVDCVITDALRDIVPDFPASLR